MEFTITNLFIIFIGAPLITLAVLSYIASKVVRGISIWKLLGSSIFAIIFSNIALLYIPNFIFTIWGLHIIIQLVTLIAPLWWFIGKKLDNSIDFLKVLGVFFIGGTMIVGIFTYAIEPLL